MNQRCDYPSTSRSRRAQIEQQRCRLRVVHRDCPECGTETDVVESYLQAGRACATVLAVCVAGHQLVGRP